ncbi:uncharacterized protein LOC141586219 [Silene latifolia]|uniref:uncharacterized protein LOC141586219 n=1 Tax=Silene latifolia TaxID=37657 RepID=UPI003D777E47
MGSACLEYLEHPKTSICGMARKVLLLKERLLALGVVADDLCYLCGRESETFEHIFQNCQYSCRLLDLLAQMGNFVLPHTDLILWIGQLQCTKLRKGILLCLVQSIFYQIWMQRNKARIEGCVHRPEIVFQLILKEVKVWVRSKLSPYVDRRDKDWLNRLHLCM